MKGYVVFLALSCGMSPKTLIKLGWPRATVYRWNKNLNKARKQLKKQLEAKILSLSDKENGANKLGY